MDVTKKIGELYQYSKFCKEPLHLKTSVKNLHEFAELGFVDEVIWIEGGEVCFSTVTENVEIIVPEQDYNAFINNLKADAISGSL